MRLQIEKQANMKIQGIVMPDSIEPWIDVPSLEISCGYGHSKTGVLKWTRLRRSSGADLAVPWLRDLLQRKVVTRLNR